ncbi:MAG: YcxB family protein [Psychromonas sp.]|nr:YcxB family protein [Alteromonadales bacterium]MCP5077562.1 YcxB family protein [Psychromonas sp.]
MQFSNQFILDRAHFTECFEQSELIATPKKMRYKFIASLLIFGFLVLIMTDQSVAVGLFFIGLAFLEFFSFKYRKAWWLSRQMWSKNSGNKITLNIDNNGIRIDSLYQKNSLLWSDIKEVIETPEGLMLKLENGGQSYLSKSSLNNEVINFIKSKLQ